MKPNSRGRAGGPAANGLSAAPRRLAPRAIEEARREAKRQASGRIVNQPKPVARGVVRGLKMLLATVLIAIVGVGLGLVLYFTPAMSARNIVVTGLSER